MVITIGRPKEPINLIITKGKKHLTKSEIEERKATEIQPCTDHIKPPAYLTAKQKKRFQELAEQLLKINILGETDVETLAHYVTAEDLYQQTVKDIRTAQKCKPKNGELTDMSEWAKMMDKLDKRQERYFKQAHTTAASLGLTISSRCKIVVPTAPEAPKESKFTQFMKTGDLDV
ncbi:MAG: phage terminase small subunit P27 family [Oscillospiraceae bacterium]|nr:phage terminase small subunit P27 family [Oscillospiraceae bacterium]